MYTENGDVLRPLPHPALGDPRVDEDRPPVRRARCRAGDYRVQDKKVTPPPRARIDESMEALIHHFKLFTEGFKVPPGETYVAVESPRGEIGCYMVSDGSGKPVRMHIRGPSFYNLQAIEPDGHRAASSPTRSRSSRASTRSWARSTGELSSTTRTCTRANEIVAQYPRPKSAILPLAHLAQDQDGWLRPRRCTRSPSSSASRRPRCSAPCSFYTMFKRRPCGKLVVSVCTNVTCLVLGGPGVLEHLEERVRDRRRRDGRRSRVPRRVRRRAGDASELRVPRAAHAGDRRRRSSSDYKSGKRKRAHDLRSDRSTSGMTDGRTRIVTKRLHDRPDDSWTIDGAARERRVQRVPGDARARRRRPTCRNR